MNSRGGRMPTKKVGGCGWGGAGAPSHKICLRYQAIKLLVDQDFIYSKLLQIHPIVPETQTLWGAKVIRSNHVTLLGHGLAEWFREWGQGCGVMDKIILACGPLTRSGPVTIASRVGNKRIWKILTITNMSKQL